MLAYIYQQNGELVLKNKDKPRLKRNNAIIKVNACSVCGTDFRIYNHGSERIAPPRIVGHEVTGTLVKVGSEIKEFKPGEKINIAPAIGCGNCYDCKNGHSNLCNDLETIGYQYDGGFAEYMEIPFKAFKEGNVIKVMDSIDSKEAAVAEPIACCINAQEYLDIEREDNVVIFGAGFIGCMHAELALSKGAANVIIVELSEKRARRADEMIEDLVVINPTETGLKEEIYNLTDDRGADVAITACSSGKAQESAQEIIANRGRISLFGGLPGESKGFVDSNKIHYKELSIFGVHASTPEQNRKALNWIAGGELEVKKYITSFPLTKIEEAFNEIRVGNVIKAVILFD